ncbi:hypothetical protein [Microcystis aeruginosa]|uniref:Uncharacterized protein n=1 Tax=Microcystis aeruginosa SPC777 TaxID=482300 RepID=S3JGU2_MICAE|nr:hypothetical protein [Microcystis aeruginosa]EPF24300.1 hypothetical protein MAESPC_00647 [Microcystis aeruginosa SPC777]OCY12537.1 MAG: hypothetical protein BEV12_01875 [Microcystis aeruginosa CACIAM 03]
MKVKTDLTIPEIEEISKEGVKALVERLGIAKAAFFLRLSQLWWVKCILRYISPSEGVERTTKTQRTQRSIDPMSIKLITQNLEEPF